MFPTDAPPPSLLSAEAFVVGNLPDYENPRRSMGFLKPLMRRAFIARQQLRYDETMRFAEDYKLYLECLLAGGVWVTVASAHYVYVVRQGSLTANHGAEDLARLCAVDQWALEHPQARAKRGLRRALRKHLISSQQRLHWVLFYTSVKAHRFRTAFSAAAANIHVFHFIARNCVDQIRARGMAYVRPQAVKS